MARNFDTEPVVHRMGMTLYELERKVIEFTLGYFDGNKAQAARSLGISVRGLELKVARYQTDDADYQERVKRSADAKRLSLMRARGLAPPEGLTLSEISKLEAPSDSSHVTSMGAPGEAKASSEDEQAADEQPADVPAAAQLLPLPVSTTQAMPERAAQAAGPSSQKRRG